MSGTPKASRQQPSRTFTNYVLTRTTSGTGLTNVAWEKFTKIDNSLLLNSASGSFDAGSASGVSTPINIGFTFNFNNTNYTKLSVSTQGFAVLVDPVTNSFTTEDIFTGAGSNSLLHPAQMTSGVPGSTMVKNHVLLAPWFSFIRNLNSSPTGGTNVSTTQRILQGIDFFPSTKTYDPQKYGVSYYLDKGPRGVRFLVRWNSYSFAKDGGTSYDASNLLFELCIYQNGNIEFRYTSKSNIMMPNVTPGRTLTSGGLLLEAACIGVFTKQSEAWRDFSPGLGYNDSTRPRYKYGGAIYSSLYSDSIASLYDTTTKPFSIGLQSYQHWPGGKNSGGVFSFQAPQNRRKILPNIIKNLDSHENFTSEFDDRKTLVYNTQVVNFPTTLTRFYGDTNKNVTLRQDLFSGDFDVSASVSKNAAEQFLTNQNTQFHGSFTEHNRPEQDYAMDSFFTTGSSLDDFGDSLNQGLRSKTQIRLSLSVNHQTLMSSASANIYYLNTKNNAWNIPRNSVSSSLSASHNVDGTVSLTVVASNSDIVNPVAFANYNSAPEDARGFGPIGNRISSGSSLAYPGASNSMLQTDTFFGAPFAQKINALTHVFPKSVQNNPDYVPTQNETFTLPVDAPFLLEKIMFQLPISMGDNWFKDITTCNIPVGVGGGIVSNNIDFGGPALTVALYCKQQNGPYSFLDLIATGTITHNFDNTSQVRFYKDPAMGSYFIKPAGFRSFAVPGAVIIPTSGSRGYTFTGSVTIPSVASITNGIIVQQIFPFGAATINGLATLLTTPQIKLQGNRSLQSVLSGSYIQQISPFGRSATGFESSGNSLFGKEFLSTNSDVVNNVFYVSSSFSDFPQSIKDSFYTASLSGFSYAVGVVPHQITAPSPYIVYPNSTLVLAISKTRPVSYVASTSSMIFSGTTGHDIMLESGSINMSFYGSYIQENKESHPSQRTIDSSNIRLVIGDEPVLDQFEFNYREMFYGSQQDDFITGTLLTRTTDARGATALTIGQRGKWFSELQARNAHTASLSASSWSRRLQPLTEYSGVPYFIQPTSNERFYDSMLPRIDDIIKIDNSLLMYYAPLNSLFTIFNNTTTFNSTFFSVSDDVWTKAFPYEAVYSNVLRQHDIKNSFITNYTLDAFGAVPSNPVRANIMPVFGKQNNFFSMAITIDTVEQNFIPGGVPYVAVSVDDDIKILYGYGDLNTCYMSASSRVGSNNLVNYRFIAANEAGFDLCFSPVIRGWKYGIYNGFPTYSKTIFRRNKFGQLRDMLEQRIDTKYDVSVNDGLTSHLNTSPVVVNFINPATGKITTPLETWSQNLSQEVTSSVPYFDGETRNRTSVDTTKLNVSTFTF